MPVQNDHFGSPCTHWLTPSPKWLLSTMKPRSIWPLHLGQTRGVSGWPRCSASISAAYKRPKASAISGRLRRDHRRPIPTTAGYLICRFGPVPAAAFVRTQKILTMMSFSTLTVLAAGFTSVLALVLWRKYREHLHAHRREREEHHESEFPLHSRGRR